MKDVFAAFAIADEKTLVDYYRLLDQVGRRELIGSLQSLLGVSSDQLELQVLRILVERARPLLISQRTWSQSVTSSDPIRGAIESHLVSILGIEKVDIPETTVTSLESIASNFREPRASLRITVDLLERSDYRCRCCGFLFRDEDLEAFGFELPDDQKVLVAEWPNIDPLHPVTSGGQLGKPRADHIWPVSLYGSNEEGNIAVLCDACNSGKANYMSYAHSAPNVGVFLPKYFSSPYVDPIVFYSVMARDEKCTLCGTPPSARPLTVRKRLREGILIPDNLRAICYQCAKPELSIS